MLNEKGQSRLFHRLLNALSGGADRYPRDTLSISTHPESSVFRRNASTCTALPYTSGLPRINDIRILVAVDALGGMAEEFFRENPDMASPHFLGVSAVREEERGERNMIIGAHYREYPTVRTYTRQVNGESIQKMRPRFRSTHGGPLQYDNVSTWYWDVGERGGPIDELAGWHIGEAFSTRYTPWGHSLSGSGKQMKVRLWGSWASDVLVNGSRIGVAPISRYSTMLGSGAGIKGMKRSLEGLLLNSSRHHERTEFRYQAYLFHAAVYGILGIEGGEGRGAIANEVIEGAGYSNDEAKRIFRYPSHFSGLPRALNLYGGDSRVMGRDSGEALLAVRESLYRKLYDLGFERRGDKPGSYIWRHPGVGEDGVYGHIAESLDFIKDADFRVALCEEMEAYRNGKEGYYDFAKSGSRTFARKKAMDLVRGMVPALIRDEFNRIGG